MIPAFFVAHLGDFVPLDDFSKRQSVHEELLGDRLSHRHQFTALLDLPREVGVQELSVHLALEDVAPHAADC